MPMTEVRRHRPVPPIFPLLLLAMAWAVAPAGSARGQGPPAEAEIRYAEAPAPGAQIVLELNPPAEPGTTHHWAQIEGPPVAIADPASPRLRVTVPEGAAQLAFRLVLRNAQGERSVRLVVPVRTAAPPADPNLPHADAGDDQIALVGRRITLDGSRSGPAGVGYRWIQLSGPKAAQTREENGYFSFVPAATGIYRFALIVGAGTALSQPDEVEVTVGQPPSRNPAEAESAAPAQAPSTSGAGTLEAVYGRVALDQVAGVLDSVADRCPLYTSFSDLTSELGRRLDAILPADPQSRQVWTKGIFEPLTQRTTLEMLPAGLDLRLLQGHQQALTAPQQDRLQAVFRTYARTLRARPSPAR